MRTLLPLNASSLEKALDGLAEGKLGMDLSPIDTHPATCPENLLPWLAKAWQVEITHLASAEQRRLIALALEIHRHQGTVHAVQKALHAVFEEARITEFEEAFVFGVQVLCKADPQRIYDASKFAQARTLIDFAKNLRSRLKGFQISLPPARLPLNLSANAVVPLSLSSTLAFEGQATLTLSGAMQWML